MDTRIRVGISQGDINGIGLEVIIKALADPMMSELCTPVLFSSQKTLSFHRKNVQLEDSNFSFQQCRDLDNLNYKKPNLINCYDEDVAIEPGKPSPAGGKYALKSLEQAVNALKAGKIDVLVTAPIDKHTIQGEEFNFPGHTEYLDAHFGNNSSLMLLIAEGLRVGVVTGHIPISQVAASITSEKILHKLRILNKSLIEDFSIRKPRIAVLGLNPHAGDNGTLGKEEQEIIAPALVKAREEGMLAYGPYPADGFFGSSMFTKFDAVLAMYHDQGLAPFKALSFNSGVNYTAGLSIIRTSPDHGTGYDIAGKDQASAESFRQAIYTACDIFRTRNMHAEASANPLKATPIKRER
jgi:4-hydroxythreonine-4-phosphate dehydrogenase